MTNVNLEHLAGRCVLSQRGKSIGYIEEICAERDDDDFVAWRCSICFGCAAVMVCTASLGTSSTSDPARPRLLCPMTEVSGMKSAPDLRE
ncbi:hypothetical protein FJ970_24780 [Mesorhizobium sp. B2-1-8]|uniref:hypothetical protein n=1 Tax=Mesorhizobium sp. B2-1-8 TaxID=2589967 RepID=UPI001D0FDF32|nr:hypothetical protein [Mesorhizobium sp. B2-1-8]UCI18281.1 hypothetical protein FJ970_24780 [Mesorhizobium sp. B2-1-8]